MKGKYAIAGGVVVAAVIIMILSSHGIFSAKSGSVTQSEGLKTGDLAPDFAVVDPQKGDISRETFSGKPLVIYFMATWCSSCYVGSESLAKYYEDSGKNFDVLLVSVDKSDTPEKLAEFKKNYGNPDWYVAKGISMAGTYNVKYLDTKYILDKDGIIRWTGSQILDSSQISSVMKQVS